MANDIRMHTINGVTEAWLITEREYKIVPDSEKAILFGPVGVSRRGMFKELGIHDPIIDHPVQWPYDIFEAEGGFVKANVLAAVALTYLTREQRDDIRKELPHRTYHDNEKILLLVEKYQIYKHAIAYIANTFEDNLAVFQDLPEATNSEGELGIINGATFTKYQSFLIEAYRPPSRGGNTKALHSHRMLIGENWYSFLALGSKQFVFKTDTVKFEYVKTPEGYLNVRKHTIVTKDAKGKMVHRGDRRFKKQLRSPS